MPLVEQIVRAVFGAFFGTLGFAMLVHVPKRAWFVSGLIASLSYLLYWFMTCLGLPDPMAIFIGALFGSLAGIQINGDGTFWSLGDFRRQYGITEPIETIY